MSEVWEETWWFREPEDEWPYIVFVNEGTVEQQAEPFSRTGDMTRDRARLAACAPEMARLLLEAEFARMNELGGAYCPWCEGRSDPGAHGVTYAQCRHHRFVAWPESEVSQRTTSCESPFICLTPHAIRGTNVPTGSKDPVRPSAATRSGGATDPR